MPSHGSAPCSAIGGTTSSPETPGRPLTARHPPEGVLPSARGRVQTGLQNQRGIHVCAVQDAFSTVLELRVETAVRVLRTSW